MSQTAKASYWCVGCQAKPRQDAVRSREKPLLPYFCPSCTPKTRLSSDIWHLRCFSFLLLSQINPGKQRRPLPLPLVPQRSPWLKMIPMGAYKNKHIYKKLQKSKKLAVFQPRHNKKPFSLVLKCYPKRNKTDHMRAVSNFFRQDQHCSQASYRSRTSI